MITANWKELVETDDGPVTLHGSPFTGIAEAYYTNGCLRSRNEYLNGIEHGTQRWWFGNGQLSEEGEMCLNQHHGYHRVWYPTGKLKTEEVWEHGVMLEIREWDEHGTLVTEVTRLPSVEQTEYLHIARENARRFACENPNQEI